MQFGICAGPEYAVVARQAGLDYFEWSVGAYLQPRQDATAFDQALQRVKTAPFACPVVNMLIPDDLKITGPAIDTPALTSYVEITLERARLAEVQVIVFGSGAARRIPDGFERQEAENQLKGFAHMLGQAASRAGVTIAVEPLNRQECNILTTLEECAAFVRRVDHPAIRLLVDAYHWAREDESPQAIVQNGDLLVHAHIATLTNRLPPGAEDFNFVPFFQALRQAGYQGRLSIEATLPPVEDQPRLVQVLRQSVAQMRAMAG